MFKLQNQFKIISFCLFVLLGILFITNNYYVMAMKNNELQNNSNFNDNNIEIPFENLPKQQTIQINNSFHEKNIIKFLFETKINLSKKLGVYDLKNLKEKYNGFLIKFNINVKQFFNTNDAKICLYSNASDLDNPIYDRYNFIGFLERIIIDNVSEEGLFNYKLKNNNHIEIYKSVFKQGLDNNLSESELEENVFKIILDFDIKKESNDLYMFFILYSYGFTESKNY
ncbi:SVM family protein, partial [Chrysanthemum yellows phytoplasma]|uniref:SVM family protein n=1 Tax=Chrysanthemum yellows phytoplasma TaxID=238674 RepID=UPI00054CBE7C